MADTQAKPPRWWPGFRRDHPLARGLVGYWPFWEGQAEKVYDVANPFDTGNHGTLTNMTEADWIAGPSGGVLDFDGDNDYVDCGAGTSLNVEALLTLVCRFKSDTTGVGQALVSKKDSGGSFPGYTMRIRAATDTLRIHLNQLSGSWGNGTIVVADGEWHTAAWSYDGTTSRMYVDGVADTPIAMAPASGPAAANLKLGANSFDGSQFLGQMDFAAIYNRVLTASQIADLTADPYALIRPPSTIAVVAGGTTIRWPWQLRRRRRTGAA